MGIVALAAAAGVVVCSSVAIGNEVKDLKYGAVLFEFYQQKYFETLVEYEYAYERGGIEHHGNYPELLKGGVSLSYGLDEQARGIFSDLIAAHTPEEVQNRAWFYLAKMLYLRGDTDHSASTLSNIDGAMPHGIDQEYRYLAALVNIKLGYFDEAETISRSFDDDSVYAPFLYFNLGVSLGKQKDYSRAVTYLKKSASYVDGSSELDRLADRSHMAIAYLYADNQDTDNAYTYINQVGTTGVYSNRALLGSGWSSVNSGSYRNALAPLKVLQQRSMAIPEVQEAVLLVPHVYEKLDLKGRAAEGFISAYDRYDSVLEQLDSAREVLKDADVLELFVRNLDEILAESDWFGTAPSVSLNSLSPFLFELMSDHSFQSVLKDMRDLYSIRNNLNHWKRKQNDFDVIIDARSVMLNTKGREQNIISFSEEQADLQTRYVAMKQSAAGLDKEEQELVQWLLSDIQFELNSAEMMLDQLSASPGISFNTEHYASLVTSNMDVLEDELEKTNELINKVENVMIELINAELDVHEERLKYYQVQSHLAKVRILDSTLSELDGPAEDAERDKPESRQSPTASGGKKPGLAGDDDAAA
jgi:tetratricopeptide (TPR) repeat protein